MDSPLPKFLTDIINSIQEIDSFLNYIRAGLILFAQI